MDQSRTAPQLPAVPVHHRFRGLDSRGGYQAYGQPPYGNAYGYQGQGYQGQGYQDPRYAAQGDLTFRCNVDYRGAVTNVRIRRNQSAYNRGY